MGGTELTWFVESNVPVFSNASKEQFDTAVGLDAFLISVAFADQVDRVSVQDIDLRRWNIHYNASQLG